MRFHIATLAALLIACAVAVFCFHDQSVELEHATARADSLEHRLHVADTLLVEAYGIIMSTTPPSATRGLPERINVRNGYIVPNVPTHSDTVSD